jgi:hypothetical protein
MHAIRLWLKIRVLSCLRAWRSDIDWIWLQERSTEIREGHLERCCIEQSAFDEAFRYFRFLNYRPNSDVRSGQWRTLKFEIYAGIGPRSIIDFAPFTPKMEWSSSGGWNVNCRFTSRCGIEVCLTIVRSSKSS